MNSPVVPGTFACALRQSFRSLLMALGAGFLLGSSAFACPSDTLSLSKLGLEIRLSSPAPGQVRIALYAGQETAPVKNLLGFDLEFTLDEILAPGASASWLPQSSWISDDDLFSAAISLDPLSHAVSLSFRRTTCQAVTGHGLLGVILLNGLSPTANPEELVRLTAGLVLEEVVNGARVAPGITDQVLESGLRAPSDLTAWPQPAHEVLNLQLPFEGAVEIEFLDLQGRTAMRRTEQARGSLRIDLGGLPEGVWFLRCRTPEGDVFSRKICKW